jgi:hypothetical protein
MTATTRYYVRVGAAEIRGPYDVMQLRGLAEAGVVTPQTQVAVERDGSWAVLETLAVQASIFPPRTMLGFKPTAFTRVNDPAPPPPDRAAVISPAASGDRTLHPEKLRVDVSHPGEASAPPKNEVQEMVCEVLELEAKFAPPRPIPSRKRINQRIKIVAVLALLGNAALGAVVWRYGVLKDEWSMLVIRGWFLIFNGALVIVYFDLQRK